VTLSIDIPFEQVKLASLIGGNSSAYYSVSCRSGYIVTGGGWNHFSGSGARTKDMHAFVNYPSNTNQWRVGLRNDSATVYEVEVYAMCMKTN
jgi:hypothetical protein